MRLVKENTRIDFLSVSRRRIALTISAILIVISIASIATRGLAFGIDFTGGVLLEVGYPQAADLDRIRGVVSDAGFTDAQVQQFGAETDVLLRLPPQPDADQNAIRRELQSTLEADEPQVQLASRRVRWPAGG